jgi:hypothetical protein
VFLTLTGRSLRDAETGNGGNGGDDGGGDEAGSPPQAGGPGHADSNLTGAER